MRETDAKNLVGCCGLYCGLCSKYQSQAPSRCKGCQLGENHSWCSIWNCCVKKHKLENCTQCNEIFKCEIFLRRKVSAWIPASDNLHQIKNIGVKKWLKEQIKRQSLLEEMLTDYNDGRSMSLYCKVCSRMPVQIIENTIKAAKKMIDIENISKSDIKSKAGIIKNVITEAVQAYKINFN